MNCDAARHWLALRHDDTVAGADAATLREAADHAADCPACQMLADDWAVWDPYLATAVQDVPIPPGLEERILAAVHAAAPTVGAAELRNMPPKSRRRRRWLVPALSMAAVALLAVGGIRYGWTPAPTVSPQALVALIQQSATQTDQAVDVESHPLPAEWRGLHNIRWVSAAALVTAEATPRTIGLVRTFEVALPRVGVVRGTMTILPRSQVAPSPPARRFAEAEIQYGPRPACLWADETSVYVCTVDGGGDVLQRLREAILPPARLT